MTAFLLSRHPVRYVAAVAVGLACAAVAAPPIVYPKPTTVDQVDDYFGTQVADPYRWLEDANSAATQAWVADENRVTEAWFERVPFRAATRERVRVLANYPKYSAPFEKKGLVFYYRNDGLQNQSVLHVQKGAQGEPEVLLDPNGFSTDSTVRLESFTPSRDARHAAYERTAIPGSDWRELHVMDLRTRKDLPEVLKDVRFSDTAWRGDGFYYSRFPTPARGTELTSPALGQAVWFHRVGTPQADDALVFEDKANPARLHGIETTHDERYAIRASSEPGRRGNDLWVRDETRPGAAFVPFIAEIGDDRFEVVDHVDGALLVLTTRGAPNGRLMLARIDKPTFADWTEAIPERGDRLESVVSAGGRLFVTYLKDVASQVEVHGLDGTLQSTITLPAPGAVAGFGGEAEARDVYYVYYSMSRPPTIYRYDIAAATSTLFRAPRIRGFDPEKFESRQVFFESRDGTRVPMFVVHRKGLALDGRNPTILYGYGGFNVSLTPWFSAARIAWLEQGGVFAVANLRGGGEYGEKWHEAGMRLKKQNVFDDCIAAANYLIAQRFTSADRLALQGGSNGGLLVGAVVNQRPDLFRVALPEVGVMDMLRYQKFSIGSAWVADYGSSDDETQFRNLLGYSPLHNIKAGIAYPATLVTTSDHDDRVVPAHSFKYIATLQEKAPGGAPKLIRIETRSGHGSSNLGKALDEAADIYSFVWANMGIVPAPVPAR